MHEFALMKNLMKQIQNIAEANNATKVVSVTVQLGALSHISADHFREHFEDDSRFTIAEGAELIVVQMDDINDPHAQDILIKQVVVEDNEEEPAGG